MTKNIYLLPDAGSDCPMVSFVNLIAGKWAIPILYRLILIDEPVRFSELQRAVNPITQKSSQDSYGNLKLVVWWTERCMPKCHHGWNIR